MNKWKKFFTALKILIRKPYLFNLIIESEEEKKSLLSKKYGLEKGLPTISLLEFVELSDKISPFSFLEGSSLLTDFALLRGICKKFQVEDYLEIGTWRGESAANVAPLVKNCYTINLPDEEMRKMKMDEDYINMHRFFSKPLPNIVHIQANSQTFEFSSLQKKFDLIFLDGDHHTESIINDTKNAFQLLKNENSIIVWHDYGFGTESTRFNVLQGIWEGCPLEKRKHLYRVSHTLCAIYIPQPQQATYWSKDTPPPFWFEIDMKYIK